MAGESQACQQPDTTAKTPAEHAHCHRSIERSGHVMILAAADIPPGEVFLGSKFTGACEVRFPYSKHAPSCRQNEPLSPREASVSVAAARVFRVCPVCKLCVGDRLIPYLY